MEQLGIIKLVLHQIGYGELFMKTVNSLQQVMDPCFLHETMEQLGTIIVLLHPKIRWVLLTERQICIRRL